jgi:hypothetical protein
MSQPNLQRVEALLAQTVCLLFSAHRDTDFPEHYIRSMAPGILRERLYQLRKAHPEAPGLVRPDPDTDEPLPPFEGVLLQPANPLDGPGYERLYLLAKSKTEQAVDCLCEMDLAFAERYIEQFAQSRMETCLRWLRERQNPTEQAQLVEEVNRMRASVGLGAVTWGETVTVTPPAPGAPSRREARSVRKRRVVRRMTSAGLRDRAAHAGRRRA